VHLDGEAGGNVVDCIVDLRCLDYTAGVTGKIVNSEKSPTAKIMAWQRWRYIQLPQQTTSSFGSFF
jgi:hypothetical protein